jgi:hypothetical protein
MKKHEEYSNYTILEILKEAFPNKLPSKRVNDFELGVLLGHQEVIEYLKVKFHYEEIPKIKEK